ncbi:hypothetical protein DES53_11942 [Roseimicrobium gellanilyticum]|uniref:Uncharacterized protein n=1 Tax=Roseimicrobium gellanilyticum TaxID=748857 RepID=A0A366H272_9BACT|nr:hypothetical protein [Roseimicrobium gellanilyticum]RBP35876.1 hypothetical protein DES53_11942 [Roseimicrobium gellanilyticum]
MLRFIPCLFALAAALHAAEPAKPDAKPAPLFRDFVGLCGHTVNFKPDLYYPVCRWVRDYHPVPWDLGDDTSKLPDWPFAKNKVSWEKIYGSWHAKGLRISVCFQIDNMQKDWKNMTADAHAYAKSFAENFGPGGKWPYVEYVELGNEPGLYDDPSYRTIFEAMARGIREGNPKMKIATCNIETGKSERYWKGTDSIKGLEDLYDVLRVHRYAIAKQWPVWSRSYPEDPAVPYLSRIQELVHWRDANTPGKPVWVSEFGWDAAEKKPDPKGEWARWEDSTDEDQARWLVRSFLLFSGMNIDKAFVYFFNDSDEARLHHASGITRNFEPKPAYHAIAWMLKSLEDYRYARTIKASLEEGYIYEFTPEKEGAPVIWAVWHPTKNDVTASLDTKDMSLQKAERMPLAKDASTAIEVSGAEGKLSLTLSTDPTFLWLAPAPK